MSQQITIDQAALRVLQTVKQFKRGLTLKDLQKRTSLTLNPALLDALKANEHLIFNDQVDPVRFVYKFKYQIENKEDILEYLADEEGGALEINEDVIESYDHVKEDIETLRSEHRILKAYNAPLKIDVIYRDHFVPEEGFSWEVHEDIRGLWNRVPRVDYVELRNYLIKKGLKISSLDVAITEKPKYDDKGGKRERKISARAVSSDLSRLASQLNLLSNYGDDASVVKVAPEEDAGEIDEETSKALLRHNIEKNPNEFRLVCDVIRLIGHWFYTDETIQALYLFIKQKLYKEIDISRAMLLQPKQVGQIMVKLHQDMLVVKTICESGLKTATGTSKQFNLWTMDLDKFVNVVKYRLEKMKDIVKNEEEEIRQTALFCNKCNSNFKTSEVMTLMDNISRRYRCSRCNNYLAEVDSKEALERNLELQNTLETQLIPLYELMADIDDAGLEENQKEKVYRPVRIVSQPGKRWQHQSKIGGYGNVEGGDSAMMDVEEDEKDKAKSSSSHHDAANEDEFTEDMDFDPKPLFFGKDFCVYLPVLAEWSKVKHEYAARLLKTVLDETAEFQGIVSGETYEYKFTEHSLFLASTRGFSAEELLYQLKLFSLNEMPGVLEELIRDCTHDVYYEAVTSYIGGKYHVKSTTPQILRDLLQEGEIRLCLESTNIIENTVDAVGDGEAETYYTLPIAQGKLEELKRISRECGVPLIDEFDIASGTSANVMRANLRAGVTPRDYQRAAVQKLFWNGFRAHSGTLVLPCGAGKTLCGISVMCLLKKPTIIFCNSILALMQWKEQILKWSELPTSAISRFASEFAHEWDPNAGVIITTYAMFSNTSNRKNAALNMIAKCNSREWGLLILDEVHLAPARVFRTVANNIKAHVKLGLTATAVREDELIEELPNLVGPKLYELDMHTLRMHNHIAPVECEEIHCPLTDMFTAAFRRAATMEEKRLIYTINPNKIRIVAALVKKHKADNHKIMIFCDNLFGLKVFSMILNMPKISGETPTHERASIITRFRNTKGGDCVLFSTVGDQSIDLPEADVVIQVALMHGSRMQEGQRIGRVQRPMAGKLKAHFYSIVCLSTPETEYAQHRRNFLGRMGYTVDVHDGSDEWKQYIGVESQVVVSTDMQNRLLKLIDNELKDRDEKRKEGSDMTEQGYEDIKADPRGIKRPAGPTKIDQIRKKQRTMANNAAKKLV